MNRQAFLTELRHAWHSLDLRTLEYALRMSSYVTEALESSDVTSLRRQCSEIFSRIRDDLTVIHDDRALYEYNRYVRDVPGRALSALYAIAALHKNEGYLTPYRNIRHILDSSVPSAEKYRCLLVEFMEALQPTRVGHFPESYSGASVGRVRTVIMQNATQLYICSTGHDQYISQLHECLLKILEKVPFLLATCERILLVGELLARVSDINTPQPASAHAESLQLRYLELVTKTALALSRRSEIAALGGVQEPEMSLPYVAKLFEIICSTSITNLVRHRTEYPGLRAMLEQLVQLGRDIASSGFLDEEQSVIFGEVHLPLVERMRELCKHIDKYTKYAAQGRSSEAIQKWQGEIVPLLHMVSSLTRAAQVSEENDTHGSGKIFRKVRLKPICQPGTTTPQNSLDLARHKYRRRCVDRFHSGLSHLMCNVHFLDSVIGQLDEKISHLCRDAGTWYDDILPGSRGGDRLTTSVYCYLGTLQGTTQITVESAANSNALIDATAALLSHALVMLDGRHISRTHSSSVQEQYNYGQSMVCSSAAESVRKLRYLAKLKQHMASCALAAPLKRRSAHADTLYINTQSHFLASVLEEGVPTARASYPTFSAVTYTHHLDTPSVTQEMPLPRVPGAAARTQYVAHASTTSDMFTRGAVRSGMKPTHYIPRESVIKSTYEFPNMQECITTRATGHTSPEHAVSTDSGASGQSAAPVTAYCDNTGYSGNSLGNSSTTPSPQVAHTHHSAMDTGIQHSGEQHTNPALYSATHSAASSYPVNRDESSVSHVLATDGQMIASEPDAHAGTEAIPIPHTGVSAVTTRGMGAVQVAAFGSTTVGVTAQSATLYTEFRDAPCGSPFEEHPAVSQAIRNTTPEITTGTSSVTRRRRAPEGDRSIAQRGRSTPYQVTCQRDSEVSYPRPSQGAATASQFFLRDTTAQETYGHIFRQQPGECAGSSAIEGSGSTQDTLASSSCQSQTVWPHTVYHTPCGAEQLEEPDARHSTVLVINDVTPATTRGVHTRIAWE